MVERAYQPRVRDLRISARGVVVHETIRHPFLFEPHLPMAASCSEICAHQSFSSHDAARAGATCKSRMVDPFTLPKSSQTAATALRCARLVLCKPTPVRRYCLYAQRVFVPEAVGKFRLQVSPIVA